jgi:hypothetical protein
MAPVFDNLRRQVLLPSKPITDLINDLLKKGDCADYVQRLLDKAIELFAGKYPHVKTISEAMDKISGAGGYQLDGKGIHTVSGDLFYAGAVRSRERFTSFLLEATALPAFMRKPRPRIIMRLPVCMKLSISPGKEAMTTHLWLKQPTPLPGKNCPRRLPAWVITER